MAAKAAKQEGVPIYTYGVGISSPKDIVVADIFTPSDVVFAKDEVPISVRVKGQNLKGESAQLILTLGGEKVDAKTVQFTQDQDEQVISMKLTPSARVNSSWSRPSRRAPMRPRRATTPGSAT